METALTDPRKTEVNEDFRVSTALFASKLETRVFTDLDEIPRKLVNIITAHVAELTTLDKTFASTDLDYRYDDDYDEDYDDDYEPEEFVRSVSVESYGFKDANDVHDAVVNAIKLFVGKRKRVVTYIDV